MAKAKTKTVRRPTKPLVPKVSCAAGVCDPERTQGLRAPVAEGTHDLVTLQGPGVFIAAHVSKQGGSDDITFVILDIDGRNVTNSSYAGAANWGLTQHNPYGLVLLQGSSIKTMTIGFPAPLLYKRSLRLAVTVNESNVQQIVGNVVHGGP
jgi:hypothetical protein